MSTPPVLGQTKWSWLRAIPVSPAASIAVVTTLLAVSSRGTP